MYIYISQEEQMIREERDGEKIQKCIFIQKMETISSFHPCFINFSV